EVARHIAHYPIRIRGTFCGSLAHADPAAEWCLTATTVGGLVHLDSTDGPRQLEADTFFKGVMTTAATPRELVIGYEMPLLAAHARVGFYEFNRRPGDFAVAMAMVVLTISKAEIVEARIGIGAVEARPRRLREIEMLLRGKPPT